MARRNLKYQFLQAINNSFRERMDKHSDKANGIRNTDKIYSCYEVTFVKRKFQKKLLSLDSATFVIV